MTAAATEPVREYGLRYRPLGTRVAMVTPCRDLVDARDKLEYLADRGHSRMVIVTREVPAWDIAPDGLPDVLRALADANLDDEISTEDAGEELAILLDVDTHAEADLVEARWRDVLEALDQYRKADDGLVDWAMVEPDLRDPELYVQRLDELVAEAIGKVIKAVAR